MKNRIACFIIFAMSFVWGIEEIKAQMPDNVAIHGFGGWAYGKTDNENQYLVGNEDGNYDNVNFSLNISANPYERLSVYFQGGYNERSGGDDVVLDYAFAEWYFTDALILRAGKVKAPFMIYTEIYDVGTLRPFFTLPPGVYHELAAEAYKGLGVTGSLYTSNGWGILYDLYGGGLDLQPNPVFNPQELTFDSFTPVVSDMIGGRLTIQTPLDGLSFGLSSYTGDVEFEINGEVPENDPFKDHYTIFGASAEYLSDRWWIRSEYLTQKDSPIIEIDVVYVEAAYKITEHWQAAARYEVADFNINIPEAQIFPESFFEHEDVALGINYWLNPNLVFKLSYHIVNGNRFANPEKAEDFLADLQKGSFDETTNLISFGVQFSF